MLIILYGNLLGLRFLKNRIITSVIVKCDVTNNSYIGEEIDVHETAAAPAHEHAILADEPAAATARDSDASFLHFSLPINVASELAAATAQDSDASFHLLSLPIEVAGDPDRLEASMCDVGVPWFAYLIAMTFYAFHVVAYIASFVFRYHRRNPPRSVLLPQTEENANKRFLKPRKLLFSK